MSLMFAFFAGWMLALLGLCYINYAGEGYSFHGILMTCITGGLAALYLALAVSHA